MICKDCIHADVCNKYCEFQSDEGCCYCRIGACNYTNNAEKCPMFADKSRFVELPCKIGDVVYSLYHWWRKEDGIVPYQITNLTITQNKKGEWKKKYRAMWLVDGKTRDWSLDFGFDEIGKKAFLTREAAEAAINKKEKEK